MFIVGHSTHRNNISWIASQVYVTALLPIYLHGTVLGPSLLIILTHLVELHSILMKHLEWHEFNYCDS